MMSIQEEEHKAYEDYFIFDGLDSPIRLLEDATNPDAELFEGCAIPVTPNLPGELSICSTSYSSASDLSIQAMHNALGPLEEKAARYTDADEEVKIRFPLTLNSDSLHRSQLLQRFYDLHLGASSGARRIFSFEALDTDNPTKYGTRAAMTALCIAQMATTFQDSTLVMEARSLYSRSLHYLAFQLKMLSPEQPEQLDRSRLDDVIGTLQALTSLAWFNCIKTDDFEWRRYAQAVLKILDIFGWQSIQFRTKRAFYYNWKYRTLFEGLTNRTKTSFTEPPDLIYIEASDVPLADSLLTEYAFHVPGLLWRSDRFLEVSKSNAVSQYMVIRLLTEIGVCISRLKQWHLQWIKCFPRRPHYRTVATNTFQAFGTLCGQYLSVFPLAYDFENPAAERDLRIYSICLLNLDLAVVAINRGFRQHCQDDQLRLQLREAQCDADTCAADLCMLIPWISQPHNMSFASIHSFLPLHFASMYYEEQGKVQQLAWCRQVKTSLIAKYGIDINWGTHGKLKSSETVIS